MDTVRFESSPPGAEAKTSTGQTCRTPCALSLPVNSPLTVTFTLNGYLPESEGLEPMSATGSSTQLRPNPVVVELAAAPPQPKQPAKKPAAPKKKAAPKAAAKPAQPPAAMSAAPAPQGQAAPAPWPATAPPQR